MRYVFDKTKWRHVLVDAGISQAEAARRAGMSPQVLSRKVGGQTTMTMNEYFTLCEIVSTAPIALIKKTEEPGAATPSSDGKAVI